MLQQRRCDYCDAILSDDNLGRYCNRNCGRGARQGSVPVRPKSAQPVCPQCSETFSPTIGKQIYCTKHCRRLATRQVRPCTICGREVLKHGPVKQISSATLCSPECKQKHTEQAEAQKKIDRFGPPRTCRWCGVTFGYSKEAYKGWCSKSCRAQYTQERRKKESVERSTRDAPVRFGEKRICAWCNSEFGYGDGGYHKWCSGSCRAQQVKDSNKRHRQQRRAREAAAMVERVSPAYIFKRDKYTCQSCKKKTKPKEATTHPLYPNLDHIIPLSKGGEHSRKNCQCLCRACNIEKSNGTLNDQLLLFG